MGTSKANIGPIGTPNPIQDWNKDVFKDKTNDPVSDNKKNDEEEDINTQEENNTSQEEKPIAWSHVKRSYSLFTKNPTKSNYKSLTTSYRKASGGNKKLSKSSIGGRKGAFVLLDFLTSITTSGFEATLERYNIGDISGLQTEEAVNKLSALFKEIDGTDEGSAASNAVIETLNKLYNDYSENPDLLTNLDIETISSYLEYYVSNYIYERISIEVTKSLENGTLTAAQVSNVEEQLKSYIEAEVNLNFSNENFSTMNLKDKNSLINQIFTDAYSLI